MPWEGRDAIRMMGRAVALDEREKKLAARAPHPRLGNAALHASLIEGGQELLSYPAECRLRLERRMLPGETEASVAAELREMLSALEKADGRSPEGCLRRLILAQPFVAGGPGEEKDQRSIGGATHISSTSQARALYAPDQRAWIQS